MLTQYTESVIKRHHNHFTITGQHSAIIGIAAAPFKGLAVYENNYG